MTDEVKRETVAVVPETFDATGGADTPFGRRWGGDVVTLSREHIAALQTGRTLAIDVQNEYVLFIKLDDDGTSQEKLNPNSEGGKHGG
jgi:hypothetical protein